MRPRYEGRGTTGSSLFALIGNGPARLDRDGVRAAFGEIESTGATCIEGIRRLSNGHEPAVLGERLLRPLLEEACAKIPSGRVALALSGGIDSAVLAALLRDRVVAYTLVPSFEDYSEEAEAIALARSLGIEVRLVRVGESDFVDALPAVIRSCECPLYNLHPVSRYLLARAIRVDGFGAIITGDGADEVFKGTSGADYLPIVDSLARAAGLETTMPFLDPGVSGFARRDPEKRELRTLACALGVPSDIAWQSKRVRLAPPMDLSRYWDAAREKGLGQALDRVPGRDTDRERVGWTTLTLFSKLLPELADSCAA